MPFLIRFALLVATSTVTCAGLSQVVGTGTYPFSSFDNKGYDAVNVGNLNVHFAIPVVSKAGRGTGFNYSLVYDGLVWATSSSSGSGTWTADPGWGFHGELNGAGISGTITFWDDFELCDPTGSSDRTSHYVYQDPYGVNHPLSYGTNTPCPTRATPNPPTTISGNGSTSDGSGYTYDGAYIHTRSGATIFPYSGSASSTYVDSNGNTITNNGSGVFRDTTGSTVLTIGGSGTGGGTRTFTYPVAKQAGGATTAVATIYYVSKTVQTSFGCSGIVESGAQTVALPDHVTLGDGVSTYAFTYENTPGVSGAVTGRLASVTLPTGGKISYAYSGGCSGSGINPDGTPATLARSTTDGSKTYARTINGSVSTITVSDEASNASIFSFANSSTGLWYETERRLWQGTNTSGTPLQDRTTQYNQAALFTSVSSPITQTDTFEMFNGTNAGGGATQLRTTNVYTATGLLTKSTQLDPQGGTIPIASVQMAYGSLGKVTSSTTYDASGSTVVTSSTFGYDETTPTATSGLPQHSAASGTRGNLTSSHVSTGSGTLDTTYVVDDAGQTRSTTSPNGTTTLGYDSTDTFAISTTLPTPSSGIGLSTSASFDSASGVLLSQTGMNADQTTVPNYDALLRPTLVKYPISGAQTTSSYDSPTQTTVASTMNTTQSTKQVTRLDAYGRVVRSAAWNGSLYYLTDSCYNSRGALQSRSMPYASSSYTGAQNCGGGDSLTYDALGRTTQVAHADGATTTWTYLSRAVQQTDHTGSNSPDVTRITQSDLIGRVVGVCEVSSNTSMPQSGSPAPCGMDVAGSGFLTSYAYDMANHKVTVNQGGQVRVFQTDAAGRPTLTQEPERGQTSYGYAYNSTGLRVIRTRPSANQYNPGVQTTTTTQYDRLSRPVSVSYLNNGSTDPLTPTKTFLYDQPGNGGSIPNAGASKGQLISMSAGSTGRSYAYDAMGRTTETVECPGDWCSSQTNHDAFRWYAWDWTGNLTSEQYASVANGQNPVSVGYSYNNAGQLLTVSGGQNDATNSPSVYTASSMTPYGPLRANYGNTLNATLQYDISGRLQGRWVCGQPGAKDCVNSLYYYGFYHEQVGNQVARSVDALNNRYNEWHYDEMGRLTSSTAHTGYSDIGFGATYDRWGNRWTETIANSGGSTSPSTSFSYLTNTNQISGFSYDAAGNLLQDAANTYQYDAEGNLLSIGGASTASFVSNALSQRVQSTASGVTDRYSLDLQGRRGTTWANDGSLKLAQYYVGAERLAFWASTDGHLHIEYADWLGTERKRVGPTGNEDGAYMSMPFGEQTGASGTDIAPGHFALLDQDLSAAAGIRTRSFVSILRFRGAGQVRIRMTEAMTL